MIVLFKFYYDYFDKNTRCNIDIISKEIREMLLDILSFDSDYDLKVKLIDCNSELFEYNKSDELIIVDTYVKASTNRILLDKDIMEINELLCSYYGKNSRTEYIYENSIVYEEDT